VLLEVLPLGFATRAEALALAAALEAPSEHPVARAFRDAVTNRSLLPPVADIAIHPGNGVEGTLAGRRVRIGRLPFAGALSGRPLPDGAETVGAGMTRVALADADGFIALFVLGDALRPGAAALVLRLKAAGITPVLLSGDGASSVAAMAQTLGIAEAHGDAQPDAKRATIARMQEAGAVVAMVGDGINDAPSLAQAQVSVSLGSATPLAQWTADVVVLSDELPRIGDAIVHARRTFRVVRQNLAWAFAYNVVAIPAAAFGHVTPLVAAVGMSVSSLLVVGNAMRVARMREAAGRS